MMTTTFWVAIGLSFTALADRSPETLGALLAEVTEHLRCHEPDQRSRPFLGQTLQVDPADAALAKFQRPLGTEQMRRKLPEARLMTDERDPPALGGARQLCHHLIGTLSRRKRCKELDRGLPEMPAASRSAVCFARTRGLVKISSIPTSSHVRPASTVFEADDAFLGQWTFVIIGPIVAAFGGDGVADDVELARRHGGFGHLGSRGWAPVIGGRYIIAELE